MTAMHADEKGRQDAIENTATAIEDLLFQSQKRGRLNKRNALDGGRSGTDSEGENMLVRSNGSNIRHNLSAQASRILNAVGQMFLMQHFLGFNTTTSPVSGLSALSNMINGHDWQMTQIFARVAFCHAELKILGVRANGVSAQFAPPVNMLNEKLYIFLWWWILAAAVITSIYLFTYIFRMCLKRREVDYVIKCIQFAEDAPRYNNIEDMDEFVCQFLGSDGMFLIRMVRLNAVIST
ncbi:unnamed protein product [Hymenolepis diminuta]|uniref:Innexin n=1 Tax=Hymenolepis diminuta TaxID=6216 RepID=A0A564XX01_HYMDI|nr:unnamed protein product [Hymenolepis diminuta]